MRVRYALTSFAPFLKAAQSKPLIRMLSSDPVQQMQAAGALGSLALEMTSNAEAAPPDTNSLKRLVRLLDGDSPEASENAALALMYGLRGTLTD